jgi:hypothetical protein
MVCLLLSSLLDLQQKRKLGLHGIQPLECKKENIISSGCLYGTSPPHGLLAAFFHAGPAAETETRVTQRSAA